MLNGGVIISRRKVKKFLIDRWKFEIRVPEYVQFYSYCVFDFTIQQVFIYYFI